LPPWQSVQPRITAGVRCIVFWSLAVWQETQPALLASASCVVWNEGAAGAMV
jgi:hypothetical protein